MKKISRSASAFALAALALGPASFARAAHATAEGTPPRYVAVVLLEFLPPWLAMSREDRAATVASLAPIFERHPNVTMRWIDADGLGHGYTDFAICEFDDLEAYHFLWEELRDTVLFTQPLLVMKDVFVGIEDGFERYEAREAGSAG